MGGEEEYYRIEIIDSLSGKKAADTAEALILNTILAVMDASEKASRYQLGSRRAIEWIMRQYQVATEKAPHNANDRKQWGTGYDNPRHILDLIQKAASCLRKQG